MEVNESPVNFFDPDLDNYPNFSDIEKKYSVYLHDGDCIYIPAFYFYQYLGRSASMPEKDGVRSSSLILILKYPENSSLLGAFIDAIENQIIS